jgi:hypothetical protein
MSCRITVAGALGVAATRAVRAQYGCVVLSNREPDCHTVLTLDSLDQPALRGLLTLLWDFGHDVIAVSTRTMEQMP